jgi:hypothetical protein
VLLHQDEVPFEEVVGNRSAGFWMVFVAVYSSEFDWRSVDAEDFVDEFCSPKTNFLGEKNVANGEHECVEIWCLRCPLVRLLDAVFQLAGLSRVTA